MFTSLQAQSDMKMAMKAVREQGSVQMEEELKVLRGKLQQEKARHIVCTSSHVLLHVSPSAKAYPDRRRIDTFQWKFVCSIRDEFQFASGVDRPLPLNTGCVTRVVMSKMEQFPFIASTASTPEP